MSKTNGTYITLQNPISLYDAKCQKLIGVFRSKTMCAKYIFGDLHNGRKDAKVNAAWQTKYKMYHNGNIYAIRTANEEQCDAIAELDYVIFNGYEEPSFSNMSSFHSNRVKMAMDGGNILKTLHENNNRIKKNKANE